MVMKTVRLSFSNFAPLLLAIVVVGAGAAHADHGGGGGGMSPSSPVCPAMRDAHPGGAVGHGSGATLGEAQAEANLKCMAILIMETLTELEEMLSNNLECLSAGCQFDHETTNLPCFDPNCHDCTDPQKPIELGADGKPVHFRNPPSFVCDNATPSSPIACYSWGYYDNYDYSCALGGSFTKQGLTKD